MQKKKINLKDISETSKKLKGLNTVCREARCPNISECFKKGHATFLILGKVCTRNCLFCSVNGGATEMPDPKEPEKVSRAVKNLKIKHAVITSPTRDDLADGGADHFLKTVGEIKKIPNVTVELLIPDFNLNKKSIEKIAKSGADIVGHNIETVERLYNIRPESSYNKSLRVLDMLKEHNSNLKTKSSIMLGLGETREETLSAMKDLRERAVDFFSAGQYLTPGKDHFSVKRILEEDEFDAIKSEGFKMGFKHIESGRYVRSSYRAERYLTEENKEY